MHFLNRIIPQICANSLKTTSNPNNLLRIQRPFSNLLPIYRPFSTAGGNGEEGDWTGKFNPPGDGLDWGGASNWSTGLTTEYFDGQVVGHQITPTKQPSGSGDSGGSGGGGRAGGGRSNFAGARWTDNEMDKLKEMEEENKKGKAFVNGWNDRMREMSVLLKQVREPGARGSYLKDSEKAEMYRLHKENPEVYTVERLAKDYRIMRQRVHAILWLKEDQEKEEKRLGHPLDDSVEMLLDTCPE